MTEHAIAPTAQRLAEENNVDWRLLTGSGKGGSVVERDVLGYLARVMSGEEATDPTPEPLPEGLSAWPEEPERRQSTAREAVNREVIGRTTDSTTSSTSNGAINRLENKPLERVAARSEKQGVSTANQTAPGAAPFSVPAPAAVTKPNAEAYTPWTVDKPAANLPKAAPRADAEAFFGSAPPKSETVPAAPTPEVDEARETKTTLEFLSRVPAAPPEDEVTEDAAARAALAELETLKVRVAELEEERKRHVNELHQLSRMQETIALQKNEGAKLGALQNEVKDLTAQLAAAQRSSERVEALAAHNRDLEARLVRARTFKSKAKAEFERVTEDNMMLEHELADLKRPRRGLFRKN